MRIALPALFGCLVITACSPDRAAAPGAPCDKAPEGVVSVIDPWVRPAPAGQRTSALYGVVCNRTGKDATLLGIVSPAAVAVEIHETTKSPSGAVSMAKLQSLKVPSGGGATLEPGGVHAMLIDLSNPIEPGAKTEFSFQFSDGPALNISAPTRDDGGGHAH